MIHVVTRRRHPGQGTLVDWRAGEYRFINCEYNVLQEIDDLEKNGVVERAELEQAGSKNRIYGEISAQIEEFVQVFNA